MAPQHRPTPGIDLAVGEITVITVTVYLLAITVTGHRIALGCGCDGVIGQVGAQARPATRPVQRDGRTAGFVFILVNCHRNPVTVIQFRGRS